MAGACPALGPHDPLVSGLLGTVDCNVQTLVHGGYTALFQPSSAFSEVLTAALTVYVALIGYRLLLGRSRMGVGDFALSAAKIGAVLALATQWATYQSVVYDTLFHGPEQLATAVLDGMQPRGSQFRGNVFVGLQRAFDDLSAGASSFSKHASDTAAAATTPTGAAPVVIPGLPAPVAAAPVPTTTAAQAAGLLSGDSFGAAMLAATAALLLVSTLGVLLAAKIVLAVLLGLGPIFIALFLFDATRGVFEGWLRAALCFAFAPLMATLLTGVSLTMLEPSLVEMEALRAQGVYALEPVFTVTLLVLVFAAVALGMLVASGIVAAGLRLPARREAAPGAVQGETRIALGQALAALPRAERVAAAAAAQERRDATIFAASTAASETAAERRVTVASSAAATRSVTADIPAEARLGQGPRRTASPRAPRDPAIRATGARTA